MIAQTGYAQSEAEVPIEEGDLEEEGEEVAPAQEGEPAPTPPVEAPPAQAPPAEAPSDEAPVEEVPEDEFLAEEGEDPAAAPPKGKGVVWGVVRDSNGEPVLEAPVDVIGTKTQVITDFDGRYRLELPPGKYSLRFFYEFHRPLRVEVDVTLGEVEQVDAELEAEAGAEIETIPVETTLEEASIESQNMERQRSASVTDGIGRQEISKTPDSDAAAAAQRVVGANIVDGRFVYVRGLGERYSNALLFGAPLPSPEPDKAAVPLDLFPALVLDSVNIAKTFTPDMPGDFAGGSVQIETRGVPEEFVFNASVSGSYNTQTTFQDRLDYAGGQTDWLAFDDGTRGMPALPDYELKRNSEKPGGDRVSSDDLIGPGKALNSPMSLRRKTAPPDHGASVVIGNGWLLGGEQKLGVIASANYKREYQLRDEILKEYEDAAGDERGFKETLDYEVERGWTDVEWGTFGSLSYQPANGHELRLMGLHSQSSRDAAALYEGFNTSTQGNVTAMQLDWVQRGLTLGQLSGRHTFKALNAADLGWDLALARATRDQPDRRDVAYTYNDPSWLYKDGSESGRHFFSSQHEDTFNSKLDWTQPIIDSTKLKIGGLSALKKRQFAARRFAFRTADRDNPVLECSQPFQLDCPDSVFVDENIDDIIQLEEGTEAETDAYDAHLNVYAGYLMGDVAVTEPLRLVGGARVEYTDQVIDPYNEFGGAEAARAELKATNWLPSAGLVFSATQKTKVRMSYGRTLARPQLRELAPFRFADYFGGRTVNGNPDLTLTRIDNYDTRFEYYPTLKEVLAFSFFFKDFHDPIEPIMRPEGTTNRLTYRNAAGAKLIGVELEGRKQLDFLTSALQGFSIITNLTLAHSRTDVGEFDYITSASRPLVNQAPWVFNFALDYENEGGTRARVLYNVSGKRLVEVGADGLPDAYEHSQHSLDVIASQKFAEHWQIKAQATNILNAQTLVTLGEADKSGDSNTIQRYEDGVDIGLGLSYTH
ncbi:MAG TPA: TonB-dependent receptor [Polyangiaceae bacterium]|nr:TonB-dependent receptor [Polyangiaceae bacterium]